MGASISGGSCMEHSVMLTFVRRLFHLRRSTRSFESPRYLLKWLLISTLIGLVAGVGAIAFYAAIHFATTAFLGTLVGYLPPEPAGEGGGQVMSLWSAARPWLLPIITAAGGLVEAIIPALIASIVGYSVFGSWSGWNPIFATNTDLAFTSPPQLLYYIVLGVLCGAVGLLYANGFYGITHLFHRLPLPRWVKPGIG